MGGEISLLMAIHCHQPVGNFDGVFSYAYEMSYLPFIQVLERHPNIKLALHYTGPLLDWLSANHPEFIVKIRALVERGQVEILSGGYYEPILTLLREQDAISQVRRLSSYVSENFNYKALGAWLAERIWEPKVPAILNKSGIEFTIVDDSHFSAVGMDVESLDGYYISEDEGLCVKVFPTSEKLRYYMPFKLPNETITYLREKMEKGFKAMTFGDDGEKFGLWPGTHQWVYKEGWLDNFFSAIESQPWIKTQTFSEFIERQGPSGMVYLPCVSYREMLEWSHGYFRNFLIKYPESNRMHKRMLMVSNKLSSLNEGHKAKTYLFMSQCNCGYWHGIFGGLYLNHLRSSIYSNLILAEVTAGVNKIGFELYDVDKDGKDEVILGNNIQRFFVNETGSVLEWDLYDPPVNISNVLARRYEPYHDRLTQSKPNNISNQEVVSIHDITVSKVKDLSLLRYDKYLRFSFMDYFVKENLNFEDFYSHEHKLEPTQLISKIINIDNNSITFGREIVLNNKTINLTKKFNLKDDGKTVELEFDIKANGKVDLDETAILALEFNYSLYDEFLSSNRELNQDLKKEIWFKDKWYGINILHRSARHFWICYYPVETISESEQGIERTYQGSCIILLWRVNLCSDRLNCEILLK